MKLRWQVWGLALCALFVLACGGGGGGGGAKVDIAGRVLDAGTGGPTTPASRVQGGGGTATTSAADGSFLLKADQGTSSLTVDTLGPSGVFVFPIAPATSATDVGDLWVGPQRVTVSGTVRDASNSNPIAGVIVRFGGRQGTTNASGVFSIPEVGYSGANPAAFWGIVGSAQGTGYFLGNFTAADKTPSAGVVTVDDVLLTPAADPNPPPPPYTIWGRIGPSADAPGTIVTLSQGGTAIRRVNVGADGFYYFWVGAGTYTASFQKGALTAPDENVVLATGAEIVRRDVTLR